MRFRSILLVDNKKLADLGAPSPCLTAYTQKDDGWQLRNEEALSFADQAKTSSGLPSLYAAKGAQPIRTIPRALTNNSFSPTSWGSF